MSRPDHTNIFVCDPTTGPAQQLWTPTGELRFIERDGEWILQNQFQAKPLSIYEWRDVKKLGSGDGQ